MGLVLILALIGTIVFKGRPVEAVMVGVVCVFCCIVLVATNRNWEHMTPFRWVMSTALLVTTLVDYVVATPVTHAVRRTVQGVFIVWYIATRVDLLAFWREGDFPESDRPF